MEDIIILAIIMTVPITAIVTSHIRKNTKIKSGILREQLELEKLKQQNYLMETEKLRLELEKMQLDTKNDPKIL
ncbi:hypothetical protein J6TS2_10200 [Heyndrickxia sporothermodurans]|nr:hypothetical protein J6TS2_10200 [Heyndrickxia sporothermodurans]